MSEAPNRNYILQFAGDDIAPYIPDSSSVSHMTHDPLPVLVNEAQTARQVERLKAMNQAVQSASMGAAQAQLPVTQSPAKGHLV